MGLTYFFSSLTLGSPRGLGRQWLMRPPLLVTRFSIFFLTDWRRRRTNFWMAKSVGSSSLMWMILPRLLVSCKLISNRSVRVDLLFLFFYFGIAKRVGSSVTNETSSVSYQISNFSLWTWGQGGPIFGSSRVLGRHWWMVQPRLLVSCRLISNFTLGSPRGLGRQRWCGEL